MTNEKSEAAAPVELCELCGAPMPAGEQMFKFHGYSGPCPKPPLKQPTLSDRLRAAWKRIDPNIEDPVGVTIASILLAEAASALDSLRAERDEAVRQWEKWSKLYEHELENCEAAEAALRQIEELADADWPREASIQDIARAALQGAKP